MKTNIKNKLICPFTDKAYPGKQIIVFPASDSKCNDVFDKVINAVVKPAKLIKHSDFHHTDQEDAKIEGAEDWDVVYRLDEHLTDEQIIAIYEEVKIINKYYKCMDFVTIKKRMAVIPDKD